MKSNHWIKMEAEVKRTLTEAYEDIEEFIENESNILTEIAKQPLQCNGYGTGDPCDPADETYKEEIMQSRKEKD